MQLEKIKALVIEEVRKATSMAIKNSKSNDSERLSQEQIRKKRADLRTEYEAKIANTLTDNQEQVRRIEGETVRSALAVSTATRRRSD